MGVVVRLLAFDPGSSATAWALVTAEGPRCTFAAAGTVPSRLERVEALMREHADAVAVERPKGYVFDPKRGAQLIATSWVAGGITWLAQQRRHPFVEFSAQEVRKALCGKANAGDAAVRDVVDANVIGAAVARTNEHVRDALALAVVAAWKLHGCIGARVS